jgi:transcription termination factor Rho
VPRGSTRREFPEAPRVSSRRMPDNDVSQLHLADLHERAEEQGIEGYRRMRREELIAALEPDDIPAEGAVITSDQEPAVEVDAEGPRDRDDEPTVEVSGILELTRQRFGFLRISGLHPDPEDVYISASQVRRCELRPGDEVAGPAREPRRDERHRALVHVDQVNGAEPLAEARPRFDAVPPTPPVQRLPLDGDSQDVLLRAVDLLAPVALGQRVLVRAAPQSGRTSLLRGIARAASEARLHLLVLLIDESSDDAAEWRGEMPDTEFGIATGETAPRDQVHVAELTLARARRLAESGEDVMVLCDSLSRLALAAGNAEEVKRLFGSGRNLAGGGSLTVVGTVLADAPDEGEADRAVFTTESALITLDPELAAEDVHPAIVARECWISNEDQLRDSDELDAVRRLRARLAELEPPDAARFLRERIQDSTTNAELLERLD